MPLAIAALVVTAIVLFQARRSVPADDGLRQRRAYVESRKSPAPTSMPAPPERAPAAPEATEARAASSTLTLTRQARDAAHADDALRQAAALRALAPGVYDDLAADVSGACTRFQREGALHARHARNQWVIDRLQAYCARFQPNEDDLDALARAETSGQRSRTQDALQAQATSQTPAAARQVAESLLASADDPYAMQAALRFLERQPDGWDFGHDLPGADSMAVPLGQAQETALLLYGCEVFRGCGPDSLDTLTYCAATEACRPGYGVVDLLRELHSPAEFRLAEQIAARLLVRRAQAQRESTAPPP